MHSRHLLRLDGRDGFPLEPCKGRKRLPHKRHLWRLEKGKHPPLVRCDRRISPSNGAKGEMILLVNQPMTVGFEKATGVPKRTYSRKPRCGATRARSYSESRSSAILRQIYPKAGLKAKLNSTIMATFIFHTPSITAVQSVSKSGLLQTFENFEGGLVDT